MSAPFEKAAMSGAFRVNGENGSVWVRGSVGGLSDDCHQPKRKTADRDILLAASRILGCGTNQRTHEPTMNIPFPGLVHTFTFSYRRVQTGPDGCRLDFPKALSSSVAHEGGYPRVVMVSLVVQPARVATVE